MVNVSFRLKSTCKDYRHALVFLWLAAAPLSECSTVVFVSHRCSPVLLCVSHIATCVLFLTCPPFIVVSATILLTKNAPKRS